MRRLRGAIPFWSRYALRREVTSRIIDRDNTAGQHYSLRLVFRP